MDNDGDHELDELVDMVKRVRSAIAARPELLNLIKWRIEDEALIASDEFQESLAQMRRGEGKVVRPVPRRRNRGSWRARRVGRSTHKRSLAPEGPAGVPIP